MYYFVIKIKYEEKVQVIERKLENFSHPLYYYEENPLSKWLSWVEYKVISE